MDRAALDVAIALGIEHGGWCPRDRRAEDRPLDARYALRETAERDYSVRTERNVLDSDGTLILHAGRLRGGTKLTRQLAERHDRPWFCLDLDGEGIDELVVDGELGPDAAAVVEVRDWIEDRRIRTLNVAGPRESSTPGIGFRAGIFLHALLRPDRVG